MPAEPLALKPIEFEPLHDRVYAQLRSVLMRGGFAPGQKLSGRKVAKALGTSEMPARAALGRLLAEKALVQNSNGTFAVPIVTRKRFREVMELRAILESHAAKEACSNISPEGLESLRGFSAGLIEAQAKGDLETYLDLNQKLKFGIYDFCPSETVRTHIELLWLQCGPFLRHLGGGPEHASAPSFCDEAVTALAKGDAAAAGEAIGRDIISGLDFLLENGDFDLETTVEN